MSYDERYELLELLGVGGMGQVYRARDRRLDRVVALKLLRGGDPDLRRRAIREARHQARIDHRNVCRVYETGTLGDDGKSFIAMQHVDGRRLDELAAENELSVDEMVEILRQVAEGVQAAHSQGLIHRDLKPGNILVSQTEEGEAGDGGVESRLHATVVDFGIAIDPDSPGLTATGSMVGTLGYMAPEQVQGRREELDRRTDVWALGVTLFELLARSLPFRADSEVGVMVQILETEPPRLSSRRPDLPRELDFIVGKCLEKEPERRYASARLLAEDLERFLRGEPVMARRASRVYRLRRWVARHRTLAAVVALAALALTMAGASVLRLRWQARAETRVAQELGREAERIAGRLRMAQLAPQHDLAAEKDQLRRRVAALEREVASRGVTAEGPGLVAAGEAYLALGDLETALDRLQTARSLGYDGVGLSRALGHALGRLYLRRSAVVRHLDDELRQAQLGQERTRLLEPAVDELGRARRPQPVDEVFVALLRGDAQEAEDLAVAALHDAPYDLDLLRWLAEARTEQATAAHRDQRTDEALEHLASARQTYRRAQSIGRSHPALYGGECELAQLRLEVELIGSAAQTDGVDSLLESCDRAVATDSRSPHALARRASVRRTLAARAMRRGENPAVHLQAAIADGEKALALDDRHLQALYHTGVAFSLRASDQAGSDEEISADLERAGALLTRCTGAAPDFVPCRLSLGVNRLETAIHMENLDLPSRDAFESAVRTFQEALELAPKLPVLHNNLGYTQSYFAEMLIQHPADRHRPSDVDQARRLLESGEQALQRAAELAPEYASARLSLGELHRVRARLRADRGEAADGPVADAVAAAAESYGSARRLAPERYWPAYLPVETHLLHAEALVDQGLDGTAAVERAAEALARVEQDFDEVSQCDRARVALVRARSDRVAGRPAGTEEASFHLRRDDCPEEDAARRVYAALWASDEAWPEASAMAEYLLGAWLEGAPDSERARILAARLAEEKVRRDCADVETAVVAWQRVLEVRPFAEPRWRPALERARDLKCLP